MAFDLDRVQKDIRELREFLKRAPKQPTPEQIHSLRTHTRRFGASLQALSIDSMPNERRLLRNLSKLLRRAGKVRDLDVLTGYVAEMRMIGEEGSRVQLLEHLGAEHARKMRRLHSFAVKHGASIRRGLNRTAAYLDMRFADNAANSAAPEGSMLPELRLQREIAAPGRLTRNNLHRYRLKVKEWRYMLQVENDAANRHLIDTLGEMKDEIGEWHDWQELLTIASKQLPSGPECKLARFFQTTANQKLKHALSVANRGRKDVRQGLARKKVQG
ncbi:MAG: CHAD domain-containing protein [Acidobacteriaceae bacterium]